MVSFSVRKFGDAVVVTLSGRLDAHGAQELKEIFDQLEQKKTVVLDLGGVTYLSSAGVRHFLTLHKAIGASGGRLVLAGMQPYCREVLRVCGLERMFELSDSVDSAMAAIRPDFTWKRDIGRFTFTHISDDAGAIEVLGDIADVLGAKVTPERVWAKPFSAKEFSIGLGGMGPSVPDVMPLMGEMMTIGGTMVWLPTDGNDTPDFLVPRQDSEEVVIRSGFNVSLAGAFNEVAEFESASKEGATLQELYRALFDIARERRPDYRGVLGLAMRAETGEIFGCSIKHAPIATQSPANGKLVTDEENFDEWFEYDKESRIRDLTGLICGVGVDTGANLNVFDQGCLKATFYLNPANRSSGNEKLHNHGVFFNPMPRGARPLDLDKEIRAVVENGEFIDMRHLLDKTRIVWALIGINYVQEFRRDVATLEG